MKETGRGLDLKRMIIVSIVSKETRRGTDIGTSMRTVIDVIDIGMMIESDTEPKSLTRAVDVGDQVRVIAGVVRVVGRVC